MTTFVVSDYTIMAIVRGMRSNGMIGYRDRGAAADALRLMNESIVWGEWRKDGCLPFDLVSADRIEAVIAEESDKPHGLKPWQVRELAWELTVEANHRKVSFTRDRAFTDEETWMACNCWLHQVDVKSPLLERPFEDSEGEHFDYLTIMAGVKVLRDRIEARHIEDGSWKRKWCGKCYAYYMRDDEGEWANIAKTHDWDLVA